jgi:hypothetical protein
LRPGRRIVAGFELSVNGVCDTLSVNEFQRHRCRRGKPFLGFVAQQRAGVVADGVETDREIADLPFQVRQQVVGNGGRQVRDQKTDCDRRHQRAGCRRHYERPEPRGLGLHARRSGVPLAATTRRAGRVEAGTDSRGESTRAVVIERSQRLLRPDDDESKPFDGLGTDIQSGSQSLELLHSRLVRILDDDENALSGPDGFVQKFRHLVSEFYEPGVHDDVATRRQHFCHGVLGVFADRRDAGETKVRNVRQRHLYDPGHTLDVFAGYEDVPRSPTQDTLDALLHRTRLFVERVCAHLRSKLIDYIVHETLLNPSQASSDPG